MSRARRRVREDEVQRFERDGVVHLEGILPVDELTRMEAPLEEALRMPETTADMTRMAEQLEASGGEALADGAVAADTPGRFLSGVDHWRHQEAFREFSCDSALPEIAAALMRSEGVFLWEDSVLVKEPGAREPTAFHQDLSYFHVDGTQVCTFWCPLDAVDADTGAVAYVRGSHRWPELYAPNLFVSEQAIPGARGEACRADPTAAAFRDGDREDELLRFDAVPGDVIVHHARTVHGAAGNRSATRRRRAISVRYCGDDARYLLRDGAPRKPHHASVRDGDPLGGPDCPRVWPPA